MTLSRLVNGLAKRGHQLHVVRPRQSPEDGQTEPENYTEDLVFGIPIPGYEELKMGLAAFPRLDAIWERFQPDAIHIATEGPLGLMALHSAYCNGWPVVSSFHTNFHSYGKHYGLGMLTDIALGAMKVFHNYTSLTLCPSEDLIRKLRREGFRNLKLMGRGVDTELFNSARRDMDLRHQWGAAPEDPVMIYVGRLAGEKNIPLAIQAYEQLRALEPRLKMVLVGDGPERPKIEKAHPELIFVGMKRGEELARHYASGDLFCFPSTTETFGNVVTEALASGLIVLGYDYAAPGKYIEDGKNGFLAPFDDSEAFLKQARRIIENQDQWPDIRQAAEDTGRSLSWNQILDQYLGHVQQALKVVNKPLQGL